MVAVETYGLVNGGTSDLRERVYIQTKLRLKYCATARTGRVLHRVAQWGYPKIGPV